MAGGVNKNKMKGEMSHVQEKVIQYYFSGYDGVGNNAVNQFCSRRNMAISYSAYRKKGSRFHYTHRRYGNLVQSFCT